MWLCKSIQSALFQRIVAMLLKNSMVTSANGQSIWSTFYVIGVMPNFQTIDANSIRWRIPKEILSWGFLHNIFFYHVKLFLLKRFI